MVDISSRSVQSLDLGLFFAHDKFLAGSGRLRDFNRLVELLLLELALGCLLGKLSHKRINILLHCQLLLLLLGDGDVVECGALLAFVVTGDLQILKFQLEALGPFALELQFDTLNDVCSFAATRDGVRDDVEQHFLKRALLLFAHLLQHFV
mmetsp:Transcript_37448/g.49245  ORF Transcript_37448/g.49245 Transcript_37448/m.49245 type:complete len:151 (-) Transcript_37448:387-839(-)